MSKQTLSEDVDLGPGNTETEAPDSIKNSQSDKISLRNRKEEQQTSGQRQEEAWKDWQVGRKLSLSSSNQIKSHCRGGPAASLRYPDGDLTKPEYQWGFQPDKIHPCREKKKSDTQPNLSHVTATQY